MQIREYLLNEGQVERVLIRNGMTMTCPDKQRPCSDRCPFCHIEDNKIILACRASHQYYFIDKEA